MSQNARTRGRGHEQKPRKEQTTTSNSFPIGSIRLRASARSAYGDQSPRDWSTTRSRHRISTRHWVSELSRQTAVASSLAKKSTAHTVATTGYGRSTRAARGGPALGSNGVLFRFRSCWRGRARALASWRVPIRPGANPLVLRARSHVPPWVWHAAGLGRMAAIASSPGTPHSELSRGAQGRGEGCMVQDRGAGLFSCRSSARKPGSAIHAEARAAEGSGFDPSHDAARLIESPRGIVSRTRRAPARREQGDGFHASPGALLPRPSATGLPTVIRTFFGAIGRYVNARLADLGAATLMLRWLAVGLPTSRRYASEIVTQMSHIGVSSRVSWP